MEVAKLGECSKITQVSKSLVELFASTARRLAGHAQDLFCGQRLGQERSAVTKECRLQQFDSLALVPTFPDLLDNTALDGFILLDDDQEAGAVFSGRLDAGAPFSEAVDDLKGERCTTSVVTGITNLFAVQF